MATDVEFRRRVLLVDGDDEFVRRCSAAIRSRSYEVLTARDGFEALKVLRGAQPDLLITELDLQRMSGFELLSVVRSRFPAVAVIALSGEYTAVNVPHQAICDAFLSKGPNLDFELAGEAERLISESPLRGSRPKATVAPVWIPKSTSGYIILTCPECMRSFSVDQLMAPPRKESCIFCGTEVPFQVSPHEITPRPSPETAAARSRQLRAKAKEAVALSQKLRAKQGLK